MSTRPGACDVLIVGGGPVGLMLGAMLAKDGVDVRVAEARTGASRRARAIGVHPPGLACLAEIGVAEALIAEGVKVRRGRVVLRGASLGAVDFGALPGPFDFVLSVPQYATERLLAARFAELAPGALLRGAVAAGYVSRADGIGVRLRTRAGEQEVHARLVVGCDGRRSGVRAALGADYPGRVYRRQFAMADLPDDSGLGSEAVVFVGAFGLVESFPLPERQRRWVTNLGRHAAPLAPASFAELVRARTGISLDTSALGATSSFLAERFCAARFASGRLVLAGDAAHVVSPIGGQGMNLGFLDAQALARIVPACLGDERTRAQALNLYSRRRRAASLRAARRAELYMSLGFAAPLGLRALALRALTSAPLVPRAARLLSMQGLEA